jgi:hypothetical protein
LTFRSADRVIKEVLVKLLVIAALAALSSAQASSTVVGSAMRFAWPVGTAATVETEYVREEGEAGREVSRIRMSHRMRVLAHPEGRQLRYDEQRAIAAAGNFQPAATALLPFWIPSTIVREDGTFSRVEESQRAQELFLVAIGPHLRAAEQFPALRDYVASMTSETATTTLQAGEWQKLVWQWVGMPSSMDPMEVTGSARALPGLTVATHTRLSVTNRRSCTRAGQSLTCATFEMKTVLDSEALAELTARLLKDAPIVPKPTIKPLELEEVIRVTMETGTMLPHEMLLTRMSLMRVDADGQSRTNRDAESRRSVFAYKDTESSAK